MHPERHTISRPGPHAASFELTDWPVQHFARSDAGAAKRAGGKGRGSGVLTLQGPWGGTRGPSGDHGPRPAAPVNVVYEPILVVGHALPIAWLREGVRASIEGAADLGINFQDPGVESGAPYSFYRDQVAEAVRALTTWLDESPR